MTLSNDQENLKALQAIGAELNPEWGHHCGPVGESFLARIALMNGKVEDVRPLLGWVLDRLSPVDQEPVVLEALRYPELVDDVLLPRFEAILKKYVSGKTATNFIQPAISARPYPQLHTAVEIFLQEALDKETWAARNYAMLANGWYGETGDFTAIKPSLEKLLAIPQSNWVHKPREEGWTNAPFVNLINAINGDRQNKELHPLTRPYAGAVMKSEVDDFSVLVSLREPEHPVILWGKGTDPIRVWDLGASAKYSCIENLFPWEYPKGEILAAAHEGLLQIADRPYKSISIPACKAAKKLRFEISCDPQTMQAMPDTYKNRYLQGMKGAPALRR